MEQEIQPQPLNPTPPNNNNKIIIVICSIIVIILLLVFGYFLFSKKQTTPIQPLQTDIIDQKTYRNEEYGFEFKYPNDWVQTPKPPDGFIFAISKNSENTYYWIKINFISKNTIDRLIKRLVPQCSLPDCELSKVDDISIEFYKKFGYATINKPGIGTVEFSVVPVNESTTIILRKIISTFKFLNSPQSDVISPQAYNVTLYAYEKDGSHIFDGAVIAVIDTSTGKIIAEQTADQNGKVVFSLTSGKTYRFQPSPLHENRVVGSVSRYIPSPEFFTELRLTEIGPSSFGAPVNTCEEKTEAINLALEQANYCETESDCKLFQPGGFSCYVYTNQSFDGSTVLQRVNDYGKVCPFTAYKCAQLEHSPACIQGKCYTGR